MRFESPKRVSDILIERVFVVECADHGVVDEAKDHRSAVMARREHWFTAHKGGRRG